MKEIKNKIHIKATKVHVYMWLHAASINSTVGKLGFFPVRSTFPPAHASL